MYQRVWILVLWKEMFLHVQAGNDGIQENGNSRHLSQISWIILYGFLGMSIITTVCCLDFVRRKTEFLRDDSNLAKGVQRLTVEVRPTSGEHGKKVNEGHTSRPLEDQTGLHAAEITYNSKHGSDIEITPVHIFDWNVNNNSKDDVCARQQQNNQPQSKLHYIQQHQQKSCQHELIAREHSQRLPEQKRVLRQHNSVRWEDECTVNRLSKFRTLKSSKSFDAIDERQQTETSHHRDETLSQKQLQVPDVLVTTSSEMDLKTPRVPDAVAVPGLIKEADEKKSYEAKMNDNADGTRHDFGLTDASKEVHLRDITTCFSEISTNVASSNIQATSTNVSDVPVITSPFNDVTCIKMSKEKMEKLQAFFKSKTSEGLAAKFQEINFKGSTRESNVNDKIRRVLSACQNVPGRLDDARHCTPLKSSYVMIILAKQERQSGNQTQEDSMKRNISIISKSREMSQDTGDLTKKLHQFGIAEEFCDVETFRCEAPTQGICLFDDDETFKMRFQDKRKNLARLDSSSSYVSATTHICQDSVLDFNENMDAMSAYHTPGRQSSLNSCTRNQIILPPVEVGDQGNINFSPNLNPIDLDIYSPDNRQSIVTIKAVSPAVKANESEIITISSPETLTVEKKSPYSSPQNLDVQVVVTSNMWPTLFTSSPMHTSLIRTSPMHTSSTGSATDNHHHLQKHSPKMKLRNLETSPERTINLNKLLLSLSHQSLDTSSATSATSTLPATSTSSATSTSTTFATTHIPCAGSTNVKKFCRSISPESEMLTKTSELTSLPSAQNAVEPPVVNNEGVEIKGTEQRILLKNVEETNKNIFVGETKACMAGGLTNVSLGNRTVNKKGSNVGGQIQSSRSNIAPTKSLLFNSFPNNLTHRTLPGSAEVALTETEALTVGELSTASMATISTFIVTASQELPYPVSRVPEDDVDGAALVTIVPPSGVHGEPISTDPATSSLQSGSAYNLEASRTKLLMTKAPPSVSSSSSSQHLIGNVGSKEASSYLINDFKIRCHGDDFDVEGAGEKLEVEVKSDPTADASASDDPTKLQQLYDNVQQRLQQKLLNIRQQQQQQQHNCNTNLQLPIGNISTHFLREQQKQLPSGSRPRSEHTVEDFVLSMDETATLDWKKVPLTLLERYAPERTRRSRKGNRLERSSNGTNNEFFY